MPVDIVCVKCSANLRVPDSKIGKISPCPRCGSLFKVERTPDGLWAIMSIVVPEKKPLALDSSASPPVPPPPPEASVPRLLARRYEQPQRAERAKIQQTPFLIEDVAVVDCPWCKRRGRIEEINFNMELECGSCERGFEVRVRSDRSHRVSCPNCMEKIYVPESMSGEAISCVVPACGYSPIRVPLSPVRVIKLDLDTDGFPPKPRRRERVRTEDVVVAGIVVAAILMSGGKTGGGMLCIRCGLRHVRNPTGVCYKCQ